MKHIFFLALLCPFLSNCQPLSLKGKIINEFGEPIPGATITVHRSSQPLNSSTTQQSALANEKGQFTIANLHLNDTLFFTAVGYLSQTEIFDYTLQGHDLTITLKRKSAMLQEVVINTGYQSLPKERATGSFTLVDNNSLNQQVGTNILARLNGMASAVAFDNSPNRPAITVRGISTINGVKTPLIILDNFPFDGDINNINPADVESITILKDAAAASIWGARAGNGVIVITTKKGKRNAPLQVDMSSSLTLVQKPNLDYLQPIATSAFIDVESFLSSNGYYNAAIGNSGRPALSPVVEILVKKASGQLSPADADAQVNSLRNLDVRDDYNKYVYTPAVNQQYALQLKGGSDKAAYLFSGGLDKNKNELSARYNRLSFHSVTEFFPFKNFRLSAALLYTSAGSRSGKTPYGTPMQNTQRIPPYTRLAAADGTPLPLYNFRQPWLDTAGGGKLLDWKFYPLDDYRHNYIIASVQLMSANFAMQYKFLSHFNIGLSYRYDRQLTVTDNIQDVDSYAARDLINRFSQLNRATGIVTYIVPNAGIMDKSNSLLQTHSFRPQLDYDNHWRKNNITAIAGAEVRQTIITAASARYYGFNPDLYTVANIDYVNTYPTYITGAKQAVPNRQQLSSVTNRFLSFYANAAYTYNGKYTASASARRDASNLFGLETNDKWNPLWSAGLGWNLSSENFYKLSFIPYLKLRLTYGFSGNIDPSRSAVTTLRYISSAADLTNYRYAAINQFANPSLRWESLRTINAAIDFGSANNIVSGTIEFYKKRGTDLFGNAPVDYTTGLAVMAIVKNVAAMKGKGVDLTLSTININRKFKWTTTALVNYNTSTVTDFYLSTTSGSSYLNSGTSVGAIPGKPLYSILTYKFGGLDSLGNPLGWVDDKLTNDYTAIRSKTGLADLAFAGSSRPSLWGSLFNTVSYKRLSLSVNLVYKFNYYFKKESISYTSLFSSGAGNADFSLRWQKRGDEKITTVPSMIYPANNNRDAFYNSSDVLVRKGDHIRLQFINLSYDAVSAGGKTSLVKQLQFYTNLANLPVIWKANRDRIDPDYGTEIPPGISATMGIRASF